MKIYVIQSYNFLRTFYLTNKREIDILQKQGECNMITLWIDTHDISLELLLLKDNILLDKITKTESLNHSTICIPALVELLKRNQLDIHDIDDIIVINGPGSFTGVRIGVTIAKTLAYTLKIPIRPATSLEVLLKDEKYLDGEFIGIEEKNGYYVGKIAKNEIVDYQYIKRKDFADWNKTHNIIFPKTIDYEWIVKQIHNKKLISPHSVNPFYVKKIEVEQ